MSSKENLAGKQIVFLLARKKSFSFVFTRKFFARKRAKKKFSAWVFGLLIFSVAIRRRHLTTGKFQMTFPVFLFFSLSHFSFFLLYSKTLRELVFNDSTSSNFECLSISFFLHCQKEWERVRERKRGKEKRKKKERKKDCMKSRVKTTAFAERTNERLL